MRLVRSECSNISIEFGILLLPEPWITTGELYGTIIYFSDVFLLLFYVSEQVHIHNVLL